MAAKNTVMMMLPISTAQDELCNWEFVNRSDCSDDSDLDSIFEVQSFDLDESIHSSSSSFSTSVASDDVDDDLDLDGGEASEIDDDDDEKVDDNRQEDEVINDVPIKDDDDVKCPHNRNDSSDHDEIRHGVLEYVAKPVFTSDLSGYNNYEVHVHDDEDEDDGEDEDGYGYGMDDELVPWEVKDVYERQRIRKSGKKSLARLIKSKRPAVVRAGCVRGKYALAFKSR